MDPCGFFMAGLNDGERDEDGEIFNVNIFRALNTYQFTDRLAAAQHHRVQHPRPDGRPQRPGHLSRQLRDRVLRRVRRSLPAARAVLRRPGEHHRSRLPADESRGLHQDSVSVPVLTGRRGHPCTRGPCMPWRVSHAQAVGIQDSLRPRLVATPLPKRSAMGGGGRRGVLAPHPSGVRRHRARRVAVAGDGRDGRRHAAGDLPVHSRVALVPGGAARCSTRSSSSRRRRTWWCSTDRDWRTRAGSVSPAMPVCCSTRRPSGVRRPGSWVSTDVVPDRRGASVPLRVEGETVGAVVRTRRGVNPVFVSPGHRADTASAVDLVLALAARYRLPEPQRRAHEATVALHARDRDRPAHHASRPIRTSCRSGRRRTGAVAGFRPADCRRRPTAPVSAPGCCRPGSESSAVPPAPWRRRCEVARTDCGAVGR